jgi:hypothetical protein
LLIRNASPDCGAARIDAWLDELKIPRKAYRMVMLLPPIYVAWTDGRIQPGRR